VGIDNIAGGRTGLLFLRRDDTAGDILVDLDSRVRYRRACFQETNRIDIIRKRLETAQRKEDHYLDFDDRRHDSVGLSFYLGRRKLMGALELAGAVASIIAKKIPGRREDAIDEIQKLEDLLAKALVENEDLLVSQIRVRMKEIRTKFEDIE